MSVRNEINSIAGANEVTLAAEASNPLPDATGEFAPLVRTQRVPRRAKSDRGLPSDESLARLARSYVEIQVRTWPKLVKAGLLAPATSELVTEMVQDFKHRHRSGKIEHGFPKRPVEIWHATRPSIIEAKTISA